MRHPLPLFLAGLLIIALAACAPAPRPVAEKTESERASVRSLVILPVQTRLNGPDGEVRQVEEGAAVLQTILAEYFADLSAVTLLTEERQQALAANLTGSQREVARQIGRRLESDAVLLVVIERFRDRQGSAYAVDQPASVAFQYQLIRVADDSTICQTQFKETQQPLFENLFALSKYRKRGLKWLTAEDLAREGFHDTVVGCAPLELLRASGS